MQTPNGANASGFKLLSFVRPPAEQPLPARLTRPMLVQTKPQPKSHSELSQASALAHDARNALTAMHLLSGLLGEPGVLSPDHAHIAKDLQSVAGTLGELIRKFELTGASIGRQAGRFAAPAGGAAPAIGAGEAVKACGRLLQTVAGSETAVHVSAESGLPPLRMSPDALSRVLLNLVKNASEAMPKGGVVRITARRALSLTAPAVLIHVSDDGPGIPAYALGQIFEPGFTSKQSSGETCGLGLAIVRELVEASGGKVRVASTRRRGTTFELRLPCLTTKR